MPTSSPETPTPGIVLTPSWLDRLQADQHLDKARHLLSEGRPDEAMDALAPIRDAEPNVDPDQLVAHRRLSARIALAQGRPETAALFLTPKEVATDPNFGLMDAASAVTLGSIYLANGDLTQAEQAYETALRLDPGAVVALSGLSEVAEGRGEIQTALRHMRQALASALAVSQTGGGDPTKAETPLHSVAAPAALSRSVSDLAERYAEAGNQDDAERLFRLALLGDGACGGALVGLGRLRADAGREDEAETLFRRALDAGRDTVDACLALAAMKEEQDKEAVAEILREAAGLAARNPDDLMRVGRALEEAGQERAAATMFARAMRLEPGLRDARRELVMALAAVGDIEEAQTHLARATKDHPNDPWPHLMAGDLHMRGQQLDPAVQAYSQALVLDAGHVGARTALAKALSLSGHWAEAVAHGVGVLAQSPGHTVARRIVSDLLTQGGFRDLARATADGRLPDVTDWATGGLPTSVAECLKRVPVFAAVSMSGALFRKEDGQSQGNDGPNVYHVRIGEVDLRVSLPDQVNADAQIQSRAMVAVMGQAGAAGLSPPLIFADATSGGIVTLAVPAAPLERAQLTNRSATLRVAQGVRRVHAAELSLTDDPVSAMAADGASQGGASSSPSGLVRELVERIKPDGAITQVAHWPDIKKRVDALVAALPVVALQPCLILDSLSGLLDTGQKIYVQDSTRIALGDPDLDVAHVINIASLGPEPETALIKAYVKSGTALDPDRVSRIRALRLVDYYRSMLEAVLAADQADEAGQTELKQTALRQVTMAQSRCRALLGSKDWRAAEAEILRPSPKQKPAKPVPKAALTPITEAKPKAAGLSQAAPINAKPVQAKPAAKRSLAKVATAKPKSTASKQPLKRVTPVAAAQPVPSTAAPVKASPIKATPVKAAPVKATQAKTDGTKRTTPLKRVAAKPATVRPKS